MRLPSSSDSGESDEDGKASKKRNKSPLSSPDCARSNRDTLSSPPITPPSTFNSNVRSRFQTSTPTLKTSKQSDDGLKEVIIELFEKHAKFVNDKINSLEKKIDFLLSQRNSAIQPICEINDDELPIPVDVNKLQELEYLLKNCDFQKKFISHILRQGGNTVKEVVNKVMDAVFDAEISLHYNFEGEKNKKSLNNTKTLNLIQRSIFTNYRHFKELEIIQVIKNWLKNKAEKQKRNFTNDNNVQQVLYVTVPSTVSNEVVSITNIASPMNEIIPSADDTAPPST